MAGPYGKTAGPAINVEDHLAMSGAARFGAARRIALVALVLTPGTALAADAAAGKAAFAKCQVCHAVDAQGRQTLGPNLHGLFGRKAGNLAGFKYSDAMKNSGITWDAETLARFLRDPKLAIPGNRMAVPGEKSAADVANLIAYLVEATR